MRGIFRVYCTGTGIGKVNSKIDSMITDDTYDIFTIKELALSHANNIASDR